MTVYYVDSSALLRTILVPPSGDPHRERNVRRGDCTKRFIRGLDPHLDDLVSTELLETEVARTLRREGLPLDAGESVLAPVEIFKHLRSDVLDAGRLEPRVLGTLDAIHLAASIRLGVDVFITYDNPLKNAVRERNCLVHQGLVAGPPIAVLSPGEDE